MDGGENEDSVEPSVVVDADEKLFKYFEIVHFEMIVCISTTTASHWCLEKNNQKAIISKTASKWTITKEWRVAYPIFQKAKSSDILSSMKLCENERTRSTFVEIL